MIGATASRSTGVWVATVIAPSATPAAPTKRPSRAANAGASRRVNGCAPTPANSVITQRRPMYAIGACPRPPSSMPGIEAVGIVGAFLVFVVLGLIAIAFLKVFLPETKDRSLEELEERFAAGQFK